MSDEPEKIEALVPNLKCPACRYDLSWIIDPRTGIQDCTVLECNGAFPRGPCPNEGKRWKAPSVTLVRLPDVK